MVGLENPLHIAILLAVLLLIFGAKRLPDMGRSLGHGLRGFKESISGEVQEPVAELNPANASPAGKTGATPAAQPETAEATRAPTEAHA